MKIKKIIKLFLAFIAISACSLEPKYERPKVEVPFKKSDESKLKTSKVYWKEFFQSPDLQRVIDLALENNRDLRVASLNIESARAAHGVAQSALLPSVSATALETRQGVPSAFAAFTPRRQYRANISFAAYELDFFGRLRNLKKSAFENYLASEEAQITARISLIAEVANAYSQLLLDMEILKITEENLAAQSDRYKFTELRYKHGIASQSDLLNAQVIIETAKTNREIYSKIVTQDKNALMLLTGIFDDRSLPKNMTISDIKINENLLDFVPSESLLLRPDIQQAEHNLKSANANIGAARAAFFPSITLTGTYGYGSRNLANLFDSKTWAFTPQVNIPIFSGGKNIENLKIANLQKKVEITQYEKAIQVAFREVLDQLAERESVTNQVKSFTEILKARQKSYDIFQLKHKQGISSAMDILDSKISLLSARQNHANIAKENIANLITLYKVLGGGSDVSEYVEK